jgi:hypothetical protein
MVNVGPAAAEKLELSMGAIFPSISLAVITGPALKLGRLHFFALLLFSELLLI